jgi:hypothetical protein
MSKLECFAAFVLFFNSIFSGKGQVSNFLSVLLQRFNLNDFKIYYFCRANPIKLFTAVVYEFS